MDEATLKHLDAWINSRIPEREPKHRAMVRAAIIERVTNDPSLIEGPNALTWDGVAYDMDFRPTDE